MEVMTSGAQSDGPTLVILAAGLGSRYGGPKQMVPIGPGGETLLDFTIFDAVRTGFERLVFVVTPEIDSRFRRLVSDRWRGVAEVHHVHQRLAGGLGPERMAIGRTRPWGTGHALLCAAEVVAEPFAVVNADDFYGRTSLRTLAGLLRAGPAPNQAALVGYRLDTTMPSRGEVSRAICSVGANMELERLVERSIVRSESGFVAVSEDGQRQDLRGSEIVSLNLWGFHPSIFEHLATGFDDFLARRGADSDAEFYLPAVVDDLLRSRRITATVFPSEDAWIGVTHPEDRPAAQDRLKELVTAGLYPRPVAPKAAATGRRRWGWS